LTTPQCSLSHHWSELAMERLQDPRFYHLPHCTVQRMGGIPVGTSFIFLLGMATKSLVSPSITFRSLR